MENRKMTVKDYAFPILNYDVISHYVKYLLSGDEIDPRAINMK